MGRPRQARPSIRRAERSTLQQRIYENLKEAVLSGVFVPGQPVSIRGLAESVGTSPIPVREAIQRLVTQGALTLLPNGSVAVPLMMRNRFEDLKNARIVIEGYATELAARNITTEEIGELEQIYEKLVDYFHKGDRLKFLEYNKNLRFILYRASRSEVLMPIIESLWLQAGPFLNLVTDSHSVDLRHYADLINALKRQDAVAARAALVRDNMSAAEHIARSTTFPNEPTVTATTL